MVNVYFHGFWWGFFEKTNPVHIQFFVDILEGILSQPVTISSFENSTVLIEAFCSRLDSETLSVVKKKTWEHSFLYSGESFPLPSFSSEYSAILCCQSSRRNIINVPHYIPYLYCNNFTEKAHTIHLEDPELFKLDNSKKDMLVAGISNPYGYDRNRILDYLGNIFPIEHIGNFRNTIGGAFGPSYNTREFQEYMGKFKFVLTMENSIGDTYITEKIFNAILSNRIPIYFGTKNVTDYINEKRILRVSDTSAESLKILSERISELMHDDDEYNSILKEPVFVKNCRTVRDIIQDTQRLLFNKKPKEYGITATFCVCNEQFEADRYSRMTKMFEDLGWNVTYMASTYKHTITNEMYMKYVKNPELITKSKHAPTRGPVTLRKSEVSISLNFIDILQTIRKNYTSGVFFICESDIRLVGDVNDIPRVIDAVTSHDPSWDYILIGTYPAVGDNVLNDVIVSKMQFTWLADSSLYSYRGVVKLLDFIEKTRDMDLSLPYDHIIDEAAVHGGFSIYYTNKHVFKQMSYYREEPSRIQGDQGGCKVLRDTEYSR